jgi:hypothetical protein
MAELVVCAGCGKSVSPALAFIRADGQHCPECNNRQEMTADQARLDARVTEDLQQSLSRRAARLAKIHGAMWAALVIILARGQDGWYTVLLAVPALLFFGLLTRKPWAFPAALALDGLAIAGAVGLGLAGAPGLVAVFAGASGAFLLMMTLLLRDAFRKVPAPAQDPDVPNLVSRR